MSKKVEASSPALKRSWFQGLKAEFAKIVWPTKKSLVSKSVLVMVVSVILGFIVAGVDWAIQNGLTFIIGK